MPKVSQEHLAARRAQIADAAARLFADRGFSATSMQQIIAASGMSAGAVYHYFPAKRDLVAAVGGRLLEAYTQPVVATLGADPLPPPAEVIREVARNLERIRSGGGTDFTQLAIFLWAEALVDPELGAQVGAVQRRLREQIEALVPRWQAQGDVDPAADPHDVAVALYALMPGLTLQLHLLGGASADGLAAGLAACTAPRSAS